MNLIFSSVNWCEWLKEYEKTDPEPVIDFSGKNRYVHMDSKGRIAGFLGAPAATTESMLLHVAWHHRMTEAYMKSEIRKTS